MCHASDAMCATVLRTMNTIDWSCHDLTTSYRTHRYCGCHRMQRQKHSTSLLFGQSCSNGLEFAIVCIVVLAVLVRYQMPGSPCGSIDQSVDPRSLLRYPMLMFHAANVVPPHQRFVVLTAKTHRCKTWGKARFDTARPCNTTASRTTTTSPTRTPRARSPGRPRVHRVGEHIVLRGAKTELL